MAAAVLMAAVAQAVTVINKTTGQTLLYDDFESASAVSHSAYPDAGGDFDPNNAAVGAWSVNEAGPSNIQVSAYLGNGRTVAFRCGASGANMQFRLDATGYDGSKQDTFKLFRDGFEGGTPGSAPTLTMPDIGTYTGIGSGVKVRTGSTSGGPAAAYSGANYLELSRVPSLGLNINCLFAGGPIMPNAQELHARFRLWWGGAGFMGHGISTNSNLSPTSFLSYNGSDAATRAYKAYNYNTSAYVNLAPAGTVPINTWFPFELVWYPSNQLATVSINGGAPVTNLFFGQFPMCCGNCIWGRELPTPSTGRTTSRPNGSTRRPRCPRRPRPKGPLYCSVEQTRAPGSSLGGMPGREKRKGAER